MRHFYQDASEAIHQGSWEAPCGIAYAPKLGWFIYDLKEGTRDCGAEPEFVFIQRGRLPLPLTEVASEVLLSAIISKLPKENNKISN